MSDPAKVEEAAANLRLAGAKMFGGISAAITLGLIPPHIAPLLKESADEWERATAEYWSAVREDRTVKT